MQFNETSFYLVFYHQQNTAEKMKKKRFQVPRFLEKMWFGQKSNLFIQKNKYPRITSVELEENDQKKKKVEQDKR